MSENMIRKTYHFKGAVQGVGFRYRATYAAREAGVEFWEIQMDFRPEGVTLYSVTRSSDL